MLSTSQTQQGQIFSQLSDLSFVQPCILPTCAPNGARKRWISTDGQGPTRIGLALGRQSQFSPFAVVICASSSSMKHGAIRPHCKHTTQLSGEARGETRRGAFRAPSFKVLALTLSCRVHPPLLAEWSPFMAAHLATPPGS